VAYVTNPQFALAYKDEEVTVAAVNKSTGELFTYKAKVTGNVNDSNQIEVKTAKGALVYVKKSSIQAGKVIPINVRVNFNQTNSVMMTAVDRTSGEIAKFNSNGERDSQGDTQLNVFAPKENATIKEVKKNLASGQPISHTLPIHTGARINTAAAYRKGKNSVYLTASVAGIDTNIQTVTPELPLVAEIPKTFKLFQGRKSKKDNRRYNYYSISRSEAEFYGPIIEEIEISLDGFLRKYIGYLPTKTFDNVIISPEYDTLVEEFKTLTGEVFNIFKNSPEGLKMQNKFFAFLESKGYKGYTELIEGAETLQDEVMYVVTFGKGPIEVEPEVTSNLSKDELAILSFDVSALENLESAAESLDQNTGQEIDNAGSCKL
jgi:hypothetical protein